VVGHGALWDHQKAADDTRRSRGKSRIFHRTVYTIPNRALRRLADVRELLAAMIADDEASAVILD
jgi:hypothetical protein